MNRFFSKLTFVSTFFLVVVGRCSAQPPLGLTAVDTGHTLEIIDGTAYFSRPSGVRSLSSDGNIDFVSIVHPTLGSPASVARAVKATDSRIYAAANFVSVDLGIQSALFRLDQPTMPIVTWEEGGVAGVDINLRSFGDIGGGFDSEATWFYLDGTTEPLPYPEGTDRASNYSNLIGVTPNGYAIGETGIPMTASSGAVMWTPEGEISFFTPFQVGDADSIRDRNGAEGPNIGWNYDEPNVSYGDGRSFTIYKEDGSSFYLDSSTLGVGVTVSHDDFAVIQLSTGVSPTVMSYYAFYPGIVPDFDNRGVPLLDIFPELAAIDIDRIHDLASVDGYLYMTLSGADGSFLFGARDPSVIVPEPATIVFCMLALAVSLRRLRTSIS